MIIRHYFINLFTRGFDGLVQYCSSSIANALEILQACTKPSIWFLSQRIYSM